MKAPKNGWVYLAAGAANLSAFAFGNCCGWTSPVLPKLMAEDASDSPLNKPIDYVEGAWITSLMALGSVISPLVGGQLADRIGRKWSLLSTSIFFSLGAILNMLATEVWVLYLSRFIQGLGVGLYMTTLPIYLGEISSDKVRGIISSLLQLFFVGGILYVYVIGPYVSYQMLQWCCLVVPLVFTAAFFFMPDSPYYLIAKNRQSDAQRSLEFLRGQSGEEVLEEMEMIQSNVKESMANKGTLKDLFMKPGNRKSLIISAGLIYFQQLSGISVVLFNSQTIFASTNTSLDPAISTIIIGAVQVVSAGFPPILAEHFNRKTLLLSSLTVMALCLVALGVFFYMQLVVGDTSKILWMPVPVMILYIVAYCLGFGPVPWIILSEIFPTDVKSLASSIVATSCWMLGFVITRWYPALNALGAYYAFWLFSIFLGMAFLFVSFVVIETKGLSLQEIQNRLNAKTN